MQQRAPCHKATHDYLVQNIVEHNSTSEEFSEKQRHKYTSILWELYHRYLSIEFQNISADSFEVFVLGRSISVNRAKKL